jgi:O-antigen/teichoic acid export membrane protein
MLTVAAGMPIVAFLFVSADKAILTFLGSQWLDAVPIFRALGPAAFIGTFNMATGWVYVSMGTTRRQFKWGIFASTMTVFAYIVGLRWGVVGVAIAYSVVLIVLRYPSVVYCFHGSHLRIRDLGVALWRPATASITAGVLLYATGMRLIVPGPVALSLVLDLVIYLVFYIVVWLLLPKGRRSAGEILEVAKDLRPAPPETKDEHDDQEENN